jgi:hypothetical protein
VGGVNLREVCVASYQVSSQYPSTTPEREPSSGVELKILALFLGIAVGILAIAAVVLIQTADNARDEAKAAVETGQMDHSSSGTGAVSLPL